MAKVLDLDEYHRRVKAATKAVAPSKRGTMNKLEAAFSRHLEFLKSQGEIVWWGFETLTIKLADKCRYSPDFLAIYPDKSLTFFETKGFMRDDALVKIKVAAAQLHWARFIVVKRIKGEWVYEEFSRRE